MVRRNEAQSTTIPTGVHERDLSTVDVPIEQCVTILKDEYPSSVVNTFETFSRLVVTVSNGIIVNITAAVALSAGGIGQRITIETIDTSFTKGS